MAKRLGKFELPNRLNKDESVSSDTYALYTVEPFESGYGYTIGNSLRRVLLSSIEGASIVEVHIDGVDHEFQSITGIVEDITDVVLNLKKVLFTSESREACSVFIDVEREGQVTAADIQESESVKVVNKDQVICTLDKKIQFKAELIVQVGRGFCPAEENKREDSGIGIIPIDSLFSPVTLVKYRVENTRVGKMTDFDKLILEVWTDGRIDPDSALKEATAIIQHQFSVFNEVSDEVIEFEKETQEISDEQNRLRKLLNMSVNEIELSVRAANCLNNANLTTVGELCTKSEPEMLKYRNFGKKSLNEIKAKLEQLGLSLGMKIDERLLNSPVNL